ncbi:hypothetical protein F1559_004669 [Cyanidiococcus yangmingshanensis]|uniref:Uncharacterized protein n=1 Tax=Cyanidiococcus yangmingshanensis TaxID=2690220 RepID=A0A7J7IK17_9RHOD|nr:hypothetical protein F1559_004669 [Cyanidiococcus yangmingshanensis]
MGLWWWWRHGSVSAREPREGRRLEQLERRISSLSRRLDARKRRKERTLAAFRLYAFFFVSFWTAYAFTFGDLLFLGAFANSRLKAAIVVTTSAAAYLFLYRIASLWYRWRIESAEEKLSRYRESKAELLEQLKQNTRFYETMKLLEKYGGVPEVSGSGPVTDPASAARSPIRGEQEITRCSGEAASQAGKGTTMVADSVGESPHGSTMARLTGRVVELLTKEDDDWTEPTTAREAVLIQHIRELQQALERERSQCLQLRGTLESLEVQLRGTCALIGSPGAEARPAAAEALDEDEGPEGSFPRLPEQEKTAAEPAVDTAVLPLRTDDPTSMSLVGSFQKRSRRSVDRSISSFEEDESNTVDAAPQDRVRSRSGIAQNSSEVSTVPTTKSMISDEKSPREAPSPQSSALHPGTSARQSPMQTMQTLRRQRPAGSTTGT